MRKDHAGAGLGQILLAGVIFGITAAPSLAQTGSGPNPDAASTSTVDARVEGPNATAADPAASGPIVETENCGDVLSKALQQDGKDAPCWAGIRTVDHWNTMRLTNGATIQGGPGFLPADESESPVGFSFAVGGLGGLIFNKAEDAGNASAYGGAGAVSGFVRRRRWELMYEDAGSLGNYQAAGSAFAGLNRAAIRANGQLTTRWLWQGSVTNAYGSDALRLVAPLDYRTVGSAEAPVADTVAYGLHSGNLVDQQEDFKIRSAESRRSVWDFAAAHTLRHYSDDGVTVQTVRGRANYTFATNRNMAIGFLAGVADQTGPSPCTLGGAGLQSLMQWGTHASLSISGSANGASSTCGKNVQFTGDASLYLRAGNRDDFYLTGNRDLSGGVIENLALLDSAGGGVRHQFTRSISARIGGAAVYGTDPKTNIGYNGVFADASVTYPLGGGFLQETAYRHYQVARVPGGDNRNVVIFTLWWSPRRNRQELFARR